MYFAKIAPLAGVLLSLTLATGCATKKYVRQQVDPVNQRVSEVEQQSNQKIAGLEEKTQAGLSRVEEKALAADNRAGQAADAAARADQRAGQAEQQAQGAHQLAQKGLARSDELAQTIENLDNYQPVTSESILFGFGKATLTEEARGKLDAIAQTVNKTAHYVIQVEGFTDATGSREYNLELSRRRANAVVHYLALDHKVPLYRIHMAGFGEAAPVADSSSRSGRQQNRRVEVKVMSPQLSASTGGSSPQTTSERRMQ